MTMPRHFFSATTTQYLAVVDPEQLVDAAQRLFPHDPELDFADTAPRAALVRLLEEYGIDEVAEQAEDLGMQAGLSRTSIDGFPDLRGIIPAARTPAAAET